MAQEKYINNRDRTRIYTAAGFCLVRAPILPVTVFQLIASGSAKDTTMGKNLLTNLPEIQQRSYDVLRSLAPDPFVTQALLVASTDIFEGLATIEHATSSNRRVERAYSSLLRYLTRMSTRPTPFGLFSGVAIATLGECTTLQLGTPVVQSLRTRPGMEWLLSLIQQIEEDKALVPHLNVVANQAVYLAGARAILPYADIYGTGDYREITLRATPAVYFVMENARAPIAYSELKNDLLDTFPQAAEQQVEGLLQQLWEHHFLMSNLRPPLTSAEPEVCVLEQLRNNPALASFASRLEEVIELERTIDHTPIGQATASIYQMVERQKQLVPASGRSPFQIDMGLHLAQAQLNREVGEAVIDAIEALLRISPPLQGRHHLQEYLTAFQERYSLDAEVPLLDLLSPETGLDAPPTYTEPPRAHPLPGLPLPDMRARDSLLCSLLSEALYQHVQEIELTDELLERLSQWRSQEIPPPPTLEMFLQIHAKSKEAIDRGEWRGVVAPAGIAYGGRSFGRFFDLIGEKGLQQLQEYIKQEEALFPDILFAELSYLPREGRGANVTIRPALRSYEIVVNTTPAVSPECVIPLSDLVVGVSENRFYLRSLSLKKEVQVTQSHLLNLYRAPNVCRFLLEVSNRRWSSTPTFDWGIAEYAPFLPRIVRKKIIVSPAQWNLTASTLEIAQAEDKFFADVQGWRRRWNVPRYVYLKFFDNRLLLDLEHPLFIAELRKELLKAKEEEGSVVLQEMIPDFEHLWLRDGEQQPYIAELVVPVIAQKAFPAISPQKPASDPIRKIPHMPISLLERRKLPGSEWIFLKLYASPKQHDEIVAGPLGSLVRSLDEQRLFDRWFFLRYADPEPHLRIRFRACQEQYSQAILNKVLSWGGELVHAGLASNLVIDAYDREVERYGGPASIDIMEMAFSVNSTAIREVVSALYYGEITLDPIAVAIFTVDRLVEHWGLHFEQRLSYAQLLSQQYDVREAFHSQRKLLCEVLQPWDPLFDASVQIHREKLSQLCAPQHLVLRKAAEDIRALAVRAELWTSEQQVLGSLVHMHLNRLLGIDPEREKRIYAFWHYTLKSLRQRPASKYTAGNQSKK